MVMANVAFLMELPASCGRLAVDLPCHSLDRPWNAWRVSVESRAVGIARAAATNFSSPVVIVAFDCGPPDGSDNNNCRCLKSRQAEARHLKAIASRARVNHP
jgi:hypothetical protein